jgi:hypothetical protein
MQHGQGFALILPFQRLIWEFEKFLKSHVRFMLGAGYQRRGYQARAGTVNFFKTPYCSLFPIQKRDFPEIPFN